MQGFSNIDLTLVSPDILELVSDWKVLDETLGSDHSVIITTFIEKLQKKTDNS
jgi:exonuclease III